MTFANLTTTMWIVAEAWQKLGYECWLALFTDEEPG